MTVEEMKEAIKNKCINTDCDECCLCPLYDNKGNCYEDLKSEEIKENYELMFGKEETEMKNEFDFNELKAGYAIKVPKYDNKLLIGIPNENDIAFCSENFDNIVGKKEIVNNGTLKEYTPIEVYGFSSDAGLFDPSTRPLLYKKEDMNFKIYKIGNLEIKPNYEGKRDGYKTEQKDFLFIEDLGLEDGDINFISIKKSELDDVINALIEIRDFIRED